MTDHIWLLEDTVTAKMTLNEARAVNRGMCFISRSTLEEVGMSEPEIRAFYDFHKALGESLERPKSGGGP